MSFNLGATGAGFTLGAETVLICTIGTLRTVLSSWSTMGPKTLSMPCAMRSARAGSVSCTVALISTESTELVASIRWATCRPVRSVSPLALTTRSPSSWLLSSSP